MSKMEIIKASDITDNLDRLSTGVESLVTAATSFLKAKSNTGQFAKLVATDSQRKLLAASVATFSAVDAKFEGVMVKQGTLLKAILKLDDHGQGLAINEIAVTNGLEPTKDIGRKGLAYALFARYPEMMRQSGKDTVAGKRLSSYLAAVQSKRQNKGHGKTGKGKGRPSLPPGATKVNSAHAFFDALYEQSTDAEAAVLITLCQKAKIEYEDWLNEWTGPEETK